LLEEKFAIALRNKHSFFARSRLCSVELSSKRRLEVPNVSVKVFVFSHFRTLHKIVVEELEEYRDRFGLLHTGISVA